MLSNIVDALYSQAVGYRIGSLQSIRKELLELVIQPELDTLSVEFGVSVRLISVPQTMPRYGVNYLLRSSRGGWGGRQPPILSSIARSS